jgi:uncharacterized C2H2 Zn-finger protein
MNTYVMHENVFNKELSYSTIINKKIIGYKDLSCNKCGKIFKTIGNLKQHLNRKTLCDSNRTILEIKLKISIEKTKQEKERTKQAQINAGMSVNYKIQNIFENSTNNSSPQELRSIQEQYVENTII